MKQNDGTNCILPVPDMKTAAHDNANPHDSISTQIPTEGEFF